MVTRQHGTNSNPQQPDLLRVCRIGRAQGLKGEVTVEVFTDDPQRRFAPGSALTAADGRTWNIVRSRSFKARWIVLFYGIEDRTAAESLRDLVLYAEADPPERMAEQNAWYPKDLIGLEVRMAAGNALGLPPGQLIGHISDVLAGTAQSLLEICLDGLREGAVASAADGNRAASADAPAPLTAADASSGQHVTALIPFVEQLVPEVDLAAHTITIDPPPGLIGLPEP